VLASALAFPKDDAAALEGAVSSVALAAREERGVLREAWLVALTSTRALDLLLASSRFEADGALGRTGKAYRLTQASAAPSASPLEAWLRARATDDTTRVAWFAGPRVLALGDTHLLHDVADVLEAGAPALSARPEFVRSQADAARADGVLFGDAKALGHVEALGPRRALVEALAPGDAPVSGSARVTPAGVLVRAELPVAVAGPGGPPHASRGAGLTLPDRLPADTALYVAADLRGGLSPAAARDRLLSLGPPLRAATGFDLADGLAELTRTGGFAVDDLFEMLGDEVAVAVFLGPEFRYALATPLVRSAAEAAGLVVAIRVDSDAAAERVLASLRQAILSSNIARVATVRTDGAGFVVAPLPTAHAKVTGLSGSDLPALHVRYARGELVAVLAREPLAQRALAAFDGAGPTLRDEPAHALAVHELLRDFVRVKQKRGRQKSERQ